MLLKYALQDPSFYMDGSDGSRDVSRVVNRFISYLMNPLPLRTLHGVVICFLLIYAVVLGLRYYEVTTIPFVYNHLNDLLVIPLVATACLHVIWWIKKDRSLRLGILSILSLVILYSGYFEYYLPGIHRRYTGDVWDVMCYGVGGILFYFLQKLS